MSDMNDLQALLIAIPGQFGFSTKVPVKGVAKKASQWRETASADLVDNIVGELVDGGKICKIELVNGGFGAGVFGDSRTQPLGVVVGA